jgi:hypothetical protein
MSIYGGKPEQFRAAASPAVFSLVSASGMVIAAALTSLILSLLDLVLAYASGWPGPAAIYAPLIDLPHGLLFSTPPLDVLYRHAPLAVPAGAGLLTLAILFFWPTDQKFATRLFAHNLALVLATLGVAAPVLHLPSIARVADTTGFPAIFWAIVFCAVAAGLVVLSERRALVLLGNFYVLQSPSERFSFWMLRVPIGLSLIAILCIANNYFAGVYAAMGALVISLIDSLSRTPKARFERLGNPMMREAAITMPMIAIVLCGVMVFLFGMDTAGIRSRAAVVSLETGLTLEPLRLVQPAGPIDSPYATPAPSPSASPEEKKLDMRWSR